MYNSLSTQNNSTDIVTITSVLGKPNCKVGTLAGNSEDIFIKLYQANHDGFLSGKSCPYLGITVEADQKKFYLWISSSDRNFPLCNHDTITFNFLRESLTMIFRKTGHVYAKERRNILVLNKYQFKYLTDNYVQSVDLFNVKTHEKDNYKFSDMHTAQYKGENQGRSLLNLVTRQILSAKTSLDVKAPELNAN